MVKSKWQECKDYSQRTETPALKKKNQIQQSVNHSCVLGFGQFVTTFFNQITLLK